MIRWLLSFVLLTHVFVTEAMARVMRVVLTESLDEIRVPVQVGDMVEFHFPEPLVHWSVGNHAQYKPGLGGLGNIVHVQASPTAPATTLHGKTWNHRVTARIYVKSAEEEPVTRVDFIDPSRRALENETIDPEKIEGSWIANVDSLQTFDSIPWQGFGHQLRLNPGVAQRTDEKIIMPFTVQNLGDLDFPLSDIELRDHVGRKTDAIIVYSEGLGREKHVIPANGRIQFTFRLLKPDRVANGWRVLLAPAAFKWTKSDDDIAVERGVLEDRLALSVRFFGGAANLTYAPGTGATEWTSMQGVGARVLLGLQEYISLEGSLDLARTGAASFADDREVSEISGRVQAGGLFHVGTDWIPFGRLGLGARFVNAKMTTSGTMDTAFHTGFILSFGGGIAARVGSRLLIGLAVAYNAPLAGSDASEWVETDLSIGWLWDVGGD